MVPQTLDIVDGFFGNVCQKGIIRRVGDASENKILPDENAFFIGEAIKVIVFVGTAAPYAKHIHICRGDMIEKPFVVSRILLGAQDLSGNIIRAFGEQRDTVHFEVERPSVFVLLLYETYGTEAGAFGCLRNRLVADREGHRKIV